MITALIALLCILIGLAILWGGFLLAVKYVEKNHRVNVLEDSYREATEHIGSLEREIEGLNQQIDQMNYEAQLNEQRGSRPRAWQPNNPLNDEGRKRG